MSDRLQKKPAERVPDAASEERLAEIRRQAEQAAKAEVAGVLPAGAPFPVASSSNGYYGLPLLKSAEWDWSIPAYFFVGGAAGAAAVIGAVARFMGGGRELERDAFYLAAGGAVVSPVLLIEDLGRHERFLNMLRVFKPQSAMSMGAWTLFFFGGATTAAAAAEWIESHSERRLPGRLLGDTAAAGSAALGLVLATYTGVLLGATAIPVWNHNIDTLPVHFAASGLATAASALELAGHAGNRALNRLAIGAAAAETMEGALIEIQQKRELEPLKAGASGWITRIGGLLSGPVPLVLRLIALGVRVKRAKQLERAAAVCAITGSVMTRIGWVMAAREAAKDPAVPLEIEPKQVMPAEPPAFTQSAPPPAPMPMASD